LIGRESVTPQATGNTQSWPMWQPGLNSGATVHGRFMQADPNATGMVVMRDTAHHGMALFPSVNAFDLRDRFGDGANLYQYLRSSIWNRSDPLGLDVGEEEDDSMDWFEEGTDALSLLDPLPGPSDFIRETARALVEDYAANLEWDVEWAMDWSLPDDDHSRGDNTWVSLALARGAYDAFDIGLPGTDASVNPTDWFADSGFSGRKAGGSRRGNAHNGFTVHVKKGQPAHREYRHVLAAAGMKRPEWEFEHTIQGVGRLDAINVDARIARELKPDTPSGRAAGRRQAERYRKSLEE
jgi:hypothetical protein